MPSYWKGKKLSSEHKKKMSDAKKISGIRPPSWLGKKLSKEHRAKLRESKLGAKNPNWVGGKTPYPQEFNSELKMKIRKRDKFTCILCGRTEREELEELNRVLCVNHIDFNKKNCKESNLNTLCLRCNVRINRNREYYTDFFNRTKI